MTHRIKLSLGKKKPISNSSHSSCLNSTVIHRRPYQPTCAKVEPTVKRNKVGFSREKENNNFVRCPICTIVLSTLDIDPQFHINKCLDKSQKKTIQDDEVVVLSGSARVEESINEVQDVTLAFLKKERENIMDQILTLERRRDDINRQIAQKMASKGSSNLAECKSTPSPAELLHISSQKTPIKEDVSISLQVEYEQKGSRLWDLGTSGFGLVDGDGQCVDATHLRGYRDLSPHHFKTLDMPLTPTDEPSNHDEPQSVSFVDRGGGVGPLDEESEEDDDHDKDLCGGALTQLIREMDDSGE